MDPTVFPLAVRSCTTIDAIESSHAAVRRRTLAGAPPRLNGTPGMDNASSRDHNPGHRDAVSVTRQRPGGGCSHAEFWLAPSPFGDAPCRCPPRRTRGRLDLRP